MPLAGSVYLARKEASPCSPSPSPSAWLPGTGSHGRFAADAWTLLPKSRQAWASAPGAGLGRREVPVVQVEQRLEGLHRARRVGGLAAVQVSARPGAVPRSPKPVNRKAARPSGAVVNVALNGSAALASLSAVTAYP